MSFATVAQFRQRYDTRLIDQLSNDADSPTAVTANIQAALDDGEAKIKSYALQGGVYTEAQLDDLAASGDTYLLRLETDLAICMMKNRRGEGVSAEFRDDVCDEAKEELEKLKNGEVVLNIAGVATLPELVELSEGEVANIDQPSSDEFFGGPVRTPTIRGDDT